MAKRNSLEISGTLNVYWINYRVFSRTNDKTVVTIAGKVDLNNAFAALAFLGVIYNNNELMFCE